MDKIEKIERRVSALVDALFQVADDLRRIQIERSSDNNLEGVARSLQSVGDSLYQTLVALNDGRGPNGKIGG